MMMISKQTPYLMPRELLLTKGAEALTDEQLLALFLRTGLKGCPVMELAHTLLIRFGSLRKIFSATQSDLCAQGLGIGPAKYTQFQACSELARRIAREELSINPAIENSAQTKKFLLSQLSHLTEETFSCLFLNTKNHVLHFETLFQGTISSAIVHPRVVLKKALKYNAATLIIAHNHPSGDPSPSQADISLTHHLKELLQHIEVRLIDHVIIGHQRCYSLAEHGLL
jgi:DNA repair protein RadC